MDYKIAQLVRDLLKQGKSSEEIMECINGQVDGLANKCSIAQIEELAQRMNEITEINQSFSVASENPYALDGTINVSGEIEYNDGSRSVFGLDGTNF